MNDSEKYKKSQLVSEMMETPEIIKNFQIKDADLLIQAIRSVGKVFLTGEGSSRIFPAKNAIYSSMRAGYELNISTEGARQAAEYDLTRYVVLAASNSGSTREVINLFDRLIKIRHENRFSITARENTKLQELSNDSFMLSCGWQQVVAATKSVVEQALFYQQLLAGVAGRDLTTKFSQLADAVKNALTIEIDSEIIRKISNAPTIYFAGRNDGVAEELTLKANEILGKKSNFLEGTYVFHGVEEAMTAEDVVVFINPFRAEQEKIQEILVDGVGLSVIAISDEETAFPTIKVEDIGEMQNYVYLAAGWNLLVETGLALGIDLDKTERARKIGNEFIG